MKKILVAVDFSDGSVRAIRAALDVAAKFRARLLILHVLHDPSDEPGFYTAKKAGKKVWRNMEESAQEKMDDFVKPYAKAGRKLDVAIVPGLPPAQILRVAQKEDVSLIVVGTRGRGRWERLLLGSVADRVIRGASCPVLAVPESPKEREKRERSSRKRERKEQKENGDQEAADEASQTDTVTEEVDVGEETSSAKQT